MPPKARPTCRVEGCEEVRHVYPGGFKSQYCRQHKHLRKSKSREGFDTMTGIMQEILEYLSASKSRGEPFIELSFPFAHGISITGLIERDWIMESPGVDGTLKYTITSRGEKALAVYQKPVQRRDGICPDCGQRPKHVRSGGVRDSYCIECLRKSGRRKRAMKRCNGNIERPCSRCKKRSRHQYAGGNYSTYCLHCERVRGRRKERKQRRLLLESIRAGGSVPLCKICKTNPRRVFPNSVSEYCSDCGVVYLRKVKLKSAFRRVGLHPVGGGS